MTAFEDKIRESMEHYEVPNSAANWVDFEKKLQKSQRTKKGFGFMSAAILGIFGALVCFYLNPIDNNDIAKGTTSEDHIKNTSNLQTTAANKTSNGVAMESNDKATRPESSERINDQDNLNQKNINQADNYKQQPKNNYSERLMMNRETGNTEQPDSDTPEVKDNATLGNIAPVKPTEVVVSSSTSCVDDAVQFSTSDRCNCTYNWDFGDNTTSQEKLPTHKYTSEGTYKVAVTVTSKETRKSVYAYRADIKIASNPIAEFEIEEPTWNHCENEHLFVTRSSPNNTHHWFVNNQLICNEKEMNFFFSEKGSHSIKFVTENEFGCISEKIETLYMEKDYNLGASNAFTPNGDSKNDVWMPKHLDCMDTEFKLIIQDMHGKVVFETSSIHNPWNGTIAGSSETVTKGETYLWTATYIDKKGKNRSAKGAITIPQL